MSGRRGKGPPGLLIWDFDGTLAERPGAWSGAIVDAIGERFPQLRVSRDEIRPHLQAGYPWHAPDTRRRFATADAWWDALAPVLLGAVRHAAGLGAAQAARLLPSIRRAYTAPESWRLFDDVMPALLELGGLGWRHVILSNHVPELEDIVEGLGIRRHFDAVYCSGRTGIEKPHREAFERVLAAHPDARPAIVIGDSMDADVRGAEAAGLRGVLVRQGHADARDRAATLEDLVDLLRGR